MEVHWESRGWWGSGIGVVGSKGGRGLSMIESQDDGGGLEVVRVKMVVGWVKGSRGQGVGGQGGRFRHRPDLDSI